MRLLRLSAVANVLDTARELVRTSDPMQGINVLRRLDAEAESAMHAVVAAAREDGATWKDIGKALDMTRQSAWERFGQE